jgi:hypothetical protein
MSRMTTPALADIPARSGLDAAAMKTTLDAANRQVGAHAVEEVNA